MILYQPTGTEITDLLDRAKRAWPHLESRIDRAVNILTDVKRNLRYDGEILGWQIASQQSDQWYAVDMGGCGCMDYLNANGNRADGRIFCKHSLAWLTYRTILANRMDAMVIDSPSIGRNLRDVLKLGQPDLIQIDGQIIGADYNTPGSKFQIGHAYDYQRSRRTFASDCDMAKFAAWLHAALPALRQRRETRAAYAGTREATFDDRYPVNVTPEWQPAQPAQGWLVSIWNHQPAPARQQVPA